MRMRKLYQGILPMVVGLILALLAAWSSDLLVDVTMAVDVERDTTLIRQSGSSINQPEVNETPGSVTYTAQ